VLGFVKEKRVFESRGKYKILGGDEMMKNYTTCLFSLLIFCIFLIIHLRQFFNFNLKEIYKKLKVPRGELCDES
jgi:hypothetical protein